MDNTDPRELLKQGVKVWNRRRPKGWICFDGIDLRGRELQGIDFHNVSLNHALMRDAYLPESNLHCAILTGAHMAGSCLEGADISCSSFKNANLRGANLKYSIIEQTDFTDANLYLADFGNARIGFANWHGTLVWENMKSIILRGGE
jgi:uncharacterized protein YjbI with pentapeptide repeats